VCVCVYISEDKRAGVAGRGVKCLHHSLVFVCVCVALILKSQWPVIESTFEILAAGKGEKRR
jgi:hypothetical protein